MLGNIPKTPSGEVSFLQSMDNFLVSCRLLMTNLCFFFQKKVSRASLTRGGSQEDPAQLLRDLQDSIEREADLREQLRYAEEEVSTLFYCKKNNNNSSNTSSFPPDVENLHLREIFSYISISITHHTLGYLLIPSSILPFARFHLGNFSVFQYPTNSFSVWFPLYP